MMGVVTELKATNGLAGRCTNALTVVGDEIRRASDRLSPGRVAWGQYLDYDHSNEQTGVYGTAAAVKTLANLGEPIESEFMRGGLEWLRDSHDSGQSRASRKKDWAVIYKLCYFLEASDPTSQEINISSTAASAFSELVARRLPDDGWGEYYVADNNKDPKGSTIATAMALYVLRRYIPFSGSSAGKDAVFSFYRKLTEMPNLSALEIAFAIVATHDYSDKHNQLKGPLIELVTMLERQTQKWRKPTMFEYHHDFTFQDAQAQTSDNRYIFLPVDAIVSYALILSGRYEQNRSYINRVVWMYATRITSNKGYSNPEATPRKSTVNHFWIVLLISAYLARNPAGTFESAKRRLRRNPHAYWLLVVFISFVAWVVAFLLIRTFSKSTDVSLSSLASIVPLVVGFIVNRLWQKADKQA